MTSAGGAWIALAAVAAACALVAALLVRSRREAARLRGRLEDARIDLENLQHAFSRFAPDEVIDRLIAEGHDDVGEKKELTVLFADLVGFTALAESVEPAVLVRILNGYFERMSQAIAEHRGYVSSLIGDGLLAFFGALTPNPWQADDAVHAALAMRAALDDYNAELEQQGLPALSIGIGLQRGAGVVGLVGSRELKEFAFVGRAVNQAARVQDLTRQYDADVILTERLQQGLDPRFSLRPLPATRVKGVEEPIAIYAVDGFDRAKATGASPTPSPARRPTSAADEG